MQRTFTLPIDLLTTGYILWHSFGYPFLFGMLILASGPISVKLLVDTYRPIWLAQRKTEEKKYAAITELINNAKVIKLYGWVENFIKKVVTVSDEVDANKRKAAMFSAYYEPIGIIMGLAPKLIFALYIYLGNELDIASTVFLMD